MALLNVFHVAHAYYEDAPGHFVVKYTLSGFQDAEDALRDAERHAGPGQRYEVRRVTRYAYNRWIATNHCAPVDGVVVAGGVQLPIAS